MAVLLRTAMSRWPSLAREPHSSRFFSSYLRAITTTTTRVTTPSTQNLLTNVQHRCLAQNVIQRRNFYSYFKRKTIEQIKDEDEVESHYELVYSAHSITYVQLGYGGIQAVAGIACFALGSALCGMPLTQISFLQEEPLEVAMFLTINLLICLGIYRVSTWYPFRIYYSEVEDQFVAIFVGIHPLAVRHVKILPGEVEPSPPGPITAVVAPWSHHLYSTSTQKIHLNVEHFTYPFYYNKLLGYDKES